MKIQTISNYCLDERDIDELVFPFLSQVNKDTENFSPLSKLIIWDFKKSRLKKKEFCIWSTESRFESEWSNEALTIWPFMCKVIIKSFFFLVDIIYW